MTGVRAELRPTLPELLERRHGVKPAVTVGVGVALLVAIGLAALLFTGETAGKRQLVHRSAPVYNLLYTPGKVRVAAPQGGEYTRLTASSGAYRAVVSIRPLRLPAFRGNVSGLLPIFAMRHTLDAPDAAGLEVLDEAKARVNDAPGYQVGLRRGDTLLRRVYVVPEDVGERDGVILELQETGKPGPAGKPVAKAAKKAFRSFRFGTERG
jgi:hypothetical protein